MRQILIEKNDNITVVDHNRCTVSTTKDLDLNEGVNFLRLPFPVRVLTGGEIRFIFKLTRLVASQGVILAGADLSDGEIEAILVSTGPGKPNFPAGSSILEASAYELLKITPVAGAPAGVALFDTDGKMVDTKKAPKKKSRR